MLSTADQWEPKSAHEWMQLDPLRRIRRPLRFYEEDPIAVFAAWSRLPSVFRRQSWREREIAAWLYDFVSDRIPIPGIRAIGVGRSSPDQFSQLAGVVMVESMSEREFYGFGIPELLEIPSVIPPRQLPFETERVPLKIESITELSELGLGWVSPDKYIRVSSPPPSQGRQTLQSGSVVFGESPAGFRVPGTITAIVSNESDERKTRPLLLGSEHVLGQFRWRVLAGLSEIAEVGRVIDSDKILDAAIAELATPWAIDYRVSRVETVPAAPIMSFINMPVQYVGAVSGHQKGWLDMVNGIPVGGDKIGVVDHLRATIPSQPGDSGALLLSGHDDDCPIAEAYESYIHPEFQHCLRCAMIGVLRAGPSSSASLRTRPQTFFTPILPILSRFWLRAWVRNI